MRPPSRSRVEIMVSMGVVMGSLVMETVGWKEGSIGEGGMKPPILKVCVVVEKLRRKMKC